MKIKAVKVGGERCRLRSFAGPSLTAGVLMISRRGRNTGRSRCSGSVLRRGGVSYGVYQQDKTDRKQKRDQPLHLLLG